MLDLKGWDIKSWPTLFPDGKFGRDYKRKVKRKGMKNVSPWIHFSLVPDRLPRLLAELAMVC